jgi:protein TonB
MMAIPDAMRLPLTFGLSGAMHVAALSGLALPPLPAGLPAQPIEVRLLEGNPDRVDAVSGAPAAAHLQTPVPKPRQERAASSSPTPAEPSMIAPPADAAALPAEEAAQLPPDDPVPERHAEPSDRAAPSLAGAAVPLPAAPAGGGLTERPGGDPHPPPGAPAGTLASPLQAPKALHTSAPDYPEEARWEKRTGLATLGFRVKTDGSVDEVRLLHSSGHADLDAAALESLRRWRFALPPGVAPASWYRYVFRFELT